jgi:hypothetical protein
LERLERVERILERVYLHTEIMKWRRQTLLSNVCLKMERLERLERTFFKFTYSDNIFSC